MYNVLEGLKRIVVTKSCFILFVCGPENTE